MSKADTVAFEYARTLSEDYNQIYDAVKYGYHQAEKDLTLSWKDIELISNILLDVFITTKEDDTPRKEKYEKVLKHFMMERE